MNARALPLSRVLRSGQGDRAAHTAVGPEVKAGGGGVWRARRAEREA